MYACRQGSRSAAVKKLVGAIKRRAPRGKFRPVVLPVFIAIAFAFFVVGVVHTHVTVTFRLRLISASPGT